MALVQQSHGRARHREPDPTSCLLFVHVPKAAGTTLKSVLRRQYKRDEIFRIDENHIGSRLEDLLALPLETRARFRAVLGHIPYGLHEQMPQECRYATFLRHPVDRVLSLYYYIVQEKSHPLHQLVTKSDITLERFISERVDGEAFNGQTRRLAGTNTSSIEARHLEKAVANLARFDAIGLAESFDASILTFCDTFGWGPPFYTRINVTNNRPPLQAVDRAILDRIAAENSIDLVLYDFACSLVARRTEHPRRLGIRAAWYAYLNRSDGGRLHQAARNELRRVTNRLYRIRESGGD